MWSLFHFLFNFVSGKLQYLNGVSISSCRNLAIIKILTTFIVLKGIIIWFIMILQLPHIFTLKISFLINSGFAPCRRSHHCWPPFFLLFPYNQPFVKELNLPRLNHHEVQLKWYLNICGQEYTTNLHENINFLTNFKTWRMQLNMNRCDKLLHCSNSYLYKSRFVFDVYWTFQSIALR